MADSWWSVSSTTSWISSPESWKLLRCIVQHYTIVGHWQSVLWVYQDDLLGWILDSIRQHSSNSKAAHWQSVLCVYQDYLMNFPNQTGHETICSFGNSCSIIINGFTVWHRLKSQDRDHTLVADLELNKTFCALRLESLDSQPTKSGYSLFFKWSAAFLRQTSWS